MNLKAYPLISDWLRLEDGRLVVTSGKVDIGQRISTALAKAVAEQTTLPWDSIDVAPVTTAGSPDEGMTSGSNSVVQSGQAIMQAAATLREAALARLKKEGDWILEDGAFRSRSSNEILPFLDAILADDFGRDIDPAVTLLPAAGTTRGMRGLREMVEGRFAFVHDIEFLGLRHARTIHPPRPNCRGLQLDSDILERAESKGIEVVRDGDFCALVGANEWEVDRMSRALTQSATWQDMPDIESTDIFKRLVPGAGVSLPVRDGRPDVDGHKPGAIENPDLVLRVERPFTLHAALAPSAAFARLHDGRLHIICHSQGIFPLRDSIAKSLGTSPDRVTIEHRPGSGCYGHNGADDAAFEAALIARLCPDTPILLKWSREDEHGYAPAGTAQAVEVAVRLDAKGQLSALGMETIGGTFRGRPRSGPNDDGETRLVANYLRDTGIRPSIPQPNLNRNGGLHRNLDPIYDIADTGLTKTLVADMPLRTSALRCLGATANVLALESAIDELAERAGVDPIAFRRANLRDTRGDAVLTRLSDTLPQVRDKATRGIAFARYKNEMAWLAAAADVAVSEDAVVSVETLRLVCDAGRVLDPDGVAAQLEGGAIQAISWALHEAATWTPDGIVSRDWSNYPVLRFDGVPAINVELIGHSENAPLGVGECAPGPVVAALVIAASRAVGFRLRRLPLRPENIVAAALAD